MQRIKKRIVASLNDGDTTRAMKSAFTLIEDINTAVENGVRLSSYIALRKAGIAKDRAAFIARELTVNFNRKGEWGAAINPCICSSTRRLKDRCASRKPSTARKPCAMLGRSLRFRHGARLVERFVGR